MVSTSRASDVCLAGIGLTGLDPMQSEFSAGRMRARVRHTQDWPWRIITNYEINS